MQKAETRIRSLLAARSFRRLLETRLLAQFGDGVFQAALAGTVLFNPQRAADPVAVAAGFAILLLPYSMVGPFAGVWLDRWSRRQVLVRANLLRAALVAVVAVLVLAGLGGALFYTAGLAVFSVNRFILAALSAALPHTTDPEDLVSANALSTTSGSVATVIGGGAGLLLSQLAGSGDAAYAALTLAAAVPYLASAAAAAGFGRPDLGPDQVARSTRLSAGEIARGMAAGARHAWSRPPAAAALLAIGLHRICFGLLTLMTLLLYRNGVHAWGVLFPAGLTGLSEVLGAGAVGTLLAAVVTPPAVRRLGKPRVITLSLVGGAVTQVGLGLPFLPPTIVAAGLALGFVAQAIKICVDTTLQETIADDYRGRVFSVYDTLFNATFVGAVVLAAFVLPATGVSYPMVLTVGAGYLIAAAGYARTTRRH